MEFPVLDTNTAIILEERNISNPDKVTYAWSIATHEEGLDIMRRESLRHPDRMYRIYFWVDSA